MNVNELNRKTALFMVEQEEFSYLRVCSFFLSILVVQLFFALAIACISFLIDIFYCPPNAMVYICLLFSA